MPHEVLRGVGRSGRTLLFQSTSWSWSLPFKWSAGIFCTKGHNPHFRMEKHPCPACTHPHPMDPISVTALCTKAAHLQHEFFHAWPAPFQALVSEWWQTASSARHKRNSIGTLLPIPLYNHLFSRMGLTKKSFNSQLRAALKERRDKTTKAVKTAKDWLIENPLCFPLSPAVSLNLWSMKGSQTGTSFSSAPKRKSQYHEAEPLPSKVTHKTATRTPKRGKETPHRPLIQPTMRHNHCHHLNHFSLLPSEISFSSGHHQNHLLVGSLYILKCTYGNDGVTCTMGQ